MQFNSCNMKYVEPVFDDAQIYFLNISILTCYFHTFLFDSETKYQRTGCLILDNYKLKSSQQHWLIQSVRLLRQELRAKVQSQKMDQKLYCLWTAKIQHKLDKTIRITRYFQDYLYKIKNIFGSFFFLTERNTYFIYFVCLITSYTNTQFITIISILIYNFFNFYFLHPIHTYMTPFELQKALQFQQLVQINPVIQLYIVKKNIERQLLRQINRNVLLQEQVRAHQAKLAYDSALHSPDPDPSQYQFSEDEFSGSQQIKNKKRKRGRKNLKNQTKNISKNFGKAIITFVEQKQSLVRRALAITGTSYEAFVEELRSRKRLLHSIAEIRALWMQSTFQYAKQMRMISIYFMKKACLGYIFGSRISNHTVHIKYRNRFIEVLKSPEEFTCIKT